jgi:hypothetical protein
LVAGDGVGVGAVADAADGPHPVAADGEADHRVALAAVVVENARDIAPDLVNVACCPLVSCRDKAPDQREGLSCHQRLP